MSALDYSKYCVLDVETNGLDSERHDLLSVSIYFPDKDEYYEKFFPLHYNEDVYTTHINGITREMLKGQRHWSQTSINTLLRKYHIEDRTVLTYGSLDEKFLYSYFARHLLLGFEHFHFFNMKRLILSSAFSEGNVTKDNLCKLLKIDGVEKVHSGKNDCRLEWELFKVIHDNPIIITGNKVELLSPNYIIPVSKLTSYPNFKYFRQIKNFSAETTVIKSWTITSKDFRTFCIGTLKGFVVEHMLNTHLQVQKQNNLPFLSHNASHNKYVGELPSTMEEVPIVLNRDGTISIPKRGWEDYATMCNRAIDKLRSTVKDMADYIKEIIFVGEPILSQELVVNEQDKVLALCDLSNYQSVLEIKSGSYYDPLQLYYEANGRDIYLLASKDTISEIAETVTFEIQKITLKEDLKTSQTMNEKRTKKRNLLKSQLAEKNIDLINYYNGKHQAKMQCKTCGHKWMMRGNEITGRTLCPKCKAKARREKEEEKIRLKKEKAEARKNPKKTILDRPVRNITTGIVYKSVKEAADAYNGTPTYISNCCAGKFEKAYKCQWEFVNEKE